MGQRGPSLIPTWHELSQEFAAWLERHPDAQPWLAASSREGEIWHLGEWPDPVYVLKRWSSTDTEPARRQYELLRCAAQQGLPVPGPAAWGVGRDGRGVLAVQYAGTAMSIVTPQRARELGALLASVHAAEPAPFARLLHRDDIASLEVVRRIRADLAGHPDLLSLAPAPQEVAAPESCRLTHGDYHAGNVMVCGERLTVVDWTDALLGDARWDAAWAGILLWIYQGNDAYRQFLASYRDHAALRLEAADLAAMETLAGLRWLALARTAPVPINREWLDAGYAWIRARSRGPTLQQPAGSPTSGVAW